MQTINRFLTVSRRLANRAEVCITTTRFCHRLCHGLTVAENRFWRLTSELTPSSKWVSERCVTTGIDVMAWEEVLSTSAH